MEIIAHRGFWKENREKNTSTAFQRAIEHGFGIETDIRDFKGELVISHDPPIGGELQLEQFINQLSLTKSTIALNIKSDGLSNKLASLVPKNQPSNFFVFDMSGPEYFRYRQLGMRTFDRRSEFELGFNTGEKPDGIWLDAFEKDISMIEWLNSGKGAGSKIVVVSPELHGRPHLDFWNELKGVDQIGDISICTDFPLEAAQYFRTLQ